MPVIANTSLSSSSSPSSISVVTEFSAIRLIGPPVLLKLEVLGVGLINFDVIFYYFWYRFHKFFEFGGSHFLFFAADFSIMSVFPF